MSTQQRKPRVLTDDVILKIHSYLKLGQDINTICQQLELKIGTVKKAIQSGRIIIPAKNSNQTAPPTKSQRNADDNEQAMGKACSNTVERVLAVQTGASCPIRFNNQIDLQHAGVLLALPALISQVIIHSGITRLLSISL